MQSIRGWSFCLTGFDRRGTDIMSLDPFPDQDAFQGSCMCITHCYCEYHTFRSRPGYRLTDTYQSPPFWLLLRAVRDFTELSVEEGGGRLTTEDGVMDMLPLAGSLPDMKSDTTSYVTLQVSSDDHPSVSSTLTECRITGSLQAQGITGFGMRQVTSRGSVDKARCCTWRRRNRRYRTRDP